MSPILQTSNSLRPGRAVRPRTTTRGRARRPCKSASTTELSRPVAAGARARERPEPTHLFRQAGRANMPFPRPALWTGSQAKRAHRCRCRCRGAAGSVDEAAREPIDAAAGARSFPPPPFFRPGEFDPQRQTRTTPRPGAGRAPPQPARIYMGRPHTPNPKPTQTQTNQQSP